MPTETRQYTQGERSCKLDSPLGDGVQVTSMKGFEAISQLYRFHIEVSTHQSDVPYKDLVGKAVTLSVESVDGPTRYFHGITSRVSILSAASAHDPGLTRYQLEIVPAMWKLTRRTDCRVWEGKSVIDIVKDVFDWKKIYNLDYEVPSTSFPTIEYAVQYRETDFNFVSRMMEEWGLAYYFRHEHGKHTLVVFDDSRTCPPCPDAEEAVCASATATEHANEIEGFTCWQQMPPGKYTVNDYDFKNPSLDQTLSSGAHGLADLTETNFEIYDFSARNASGVADKVEQLRMEAEEAASGRAAGVSGCPAFVPGSHVRVKGHFRSDLDGKYLITRVEHTFLDENDEDDDDDEEDEGGEGTSYENTLEFLSSKVVYRPLQLTPKPVIQGSQTALVVGPAGEEIHCDEYGRIRIQFPWDRNGPGNGDKVCWARVVQGSAGKSWGAVFTPRIGQEVIVSFLEGDPDRPIVTGVVYNAEQMPPYELPTNKTQSGIKTRSSKGAGAENFNEIRFEDKKGSEGVTIHAEKDMSTSVENDESLSVGHDRSVTVKHDETHTVKDGKRTTSIKLDDKLDVEEGNLFITVKKENIRVNASAKDIAFIGEKNVKTTASKECVTIDAGQKVVITAVDEIKLQVGGHFLSIKKNGEITVSGDKITSTGQSEAKMGVGSNNVTCDKQKVATSGAAINSSAVGMHEISGALVKIN